jgi:hypothetical protein
MAGQGRERLVAYTTVGDDQFFKAIIATLQMGGITATAAIGHGSGAGSRGIASGRVMTIVVGEKITQLFQQ